MEFGEDGGAADGEMTLFRGVGGDAAVFCVDDDAAVRDVGDVVTLEGL